MKTITERTMVPISWAAAALTSLLAPTIIGAMWVKGVNDRLTRIEAHLHIAQELGSRGIPLVGSANASESK